MKLTKIFNVVLLVIVFSLIGAIYYGLITHNQVRSNLQAKVDELEKTSQENDIKAKENATDRDSIRNIWEDQTAVNDEIIISQTEALQTLNEFLRILDDSITISENSINLKTQEKSSQLVKKRNVLETDLLDLEKATGQNVIFKEGAKTKIDDIYIRIGRNQPNTAPTE